MRGLAVLFVAALVAAAPPAPPAGWTLRDPAGQPFAVPAAGAKATVCFFVTTECPTANRYLRRLGQLHDRFGGRGVTFFLVYPHAHETAADVRQHLGASGLKVGALCDPGQQLADALQVRTTPTAVVLDPEGRVVYRGAVDDHKTEELAKHHYLRDALEATLAGQAVAVAETPSPGCAIQRALPEAKDATATYAGGVGAILNRHCVQCHRPGQVAPFSLVGYEQARRWSANVKQYTRSRAMPPWKPANLGAFRGERRLSDAEIDLLGRWADAGAPLGDPAQAPPPPVFADTWQLGTPDLVLGMTEDYLIDEHGTDEYRCFVLDPKLTEDRYVQAVEFRPGNPRIVHHVMTYIDAFGVAAGKEGKDGKPGFASRGTGPGFFPAGDLGGWGPGMQPCPLDDGTARHLPKIAKVVMEVHYHKNGRPEKDRTQIGLYFAKKPVTKRVRSQVVLDLKFQIPPGARRHPVSASWAVKEDLHAVAVIPHMHLIGKEIKVTAAYPDGTEKLVVHVPEWDFNWQETYQFIKPLALPKGTRVTVTGWFDNSAENPSNPNNPPRLMRFGEQTTDEMCVAYIAYTRDAEGAGP
jgi:mono/diheme cytochrome c family protein